MAALSVCFLRHQNTIPDGVFPLQSGSLLGSHFHNLASEGKLIEQLIAQCPAGSDSKGEMRPWTDIPLHASLLSPRSGIHFCQITVIVSNGMFMIAQQWRRRRSEGGGFHTPLATCNMSRPSLVGSRRGLFLLWTSVNRLCSCLSRQPWSPTTPRCIMWMWFAARRADRPPESYRDWIIYKVLEYCLGNYNTQALFLYAVLSRSHGWYVHTLCVLSSFYKRSQKNMLQGQKQLFHLVRNSPSGYKKNPPWITKILNHRVPCILGVDGQLLFFLTSGQKRIIPSSQWSFSYLYHSQWMSGFCVLRITEQRLRF